MKALPCCRQSSVEGKNILELPDEVLCSIFLQLIHHLKDLCSISRTCLTFQRIVSDSRFKITKDTVYNAEDLIDTSLAEFVSENIGRSTLVLKFSRKQHYLPHWWNVKIVRNLEKSFQSLTTLHIHDCSIDATRFKARSLPKNLKFIHLVGCSISEHVNWKSFMFGLPYLTSSSQMFELMLSDWEKLKIERVYIDNCRDCLGTPYGIALWMHLYHRLEDQGSWQNHHPNFNGQKWQKKTIRGVETFTRYKAGQNGQGHKCNVQINRRSCPSKRIMVFFSHDKRLPPKDLSFYNGSFTSQPSRFRAILRRVLLLTALPCLAFLALFFWLALSGHVLAFWLTYLPSLPVILCIDSLVFYYSVSYYAGLTATYPLGPQWLQIFVSTLQLMCLAKVVFMLITLLYVILIPISIISSVS